MSHYHNLRCLNSQVNHKIHHPGIPKHHQSCQDRGESHTNLPVCLGSQTVWEVVNRHHVLLSPQRDHYLRQRQRLQYRMRYLIPAFQRCQTSLQRQRLRQHQQCLIAQQCHCLRHLCQILIRCLSCLCQHQILRWFLNHRSQMVSHLSSLRGYRNQMLLWGLVTRPG